MEDGAAQEIQKQQKDTRKMKPALMSRSPCADPGGAITRIITATSLTNRVLPRHFFIQSLSGLLLADSSKNLARQVPMRG